MVEISQHDIPSLIAKPRFDQYEIQIAIPRSQIYLQSLVKYSPIVNMGTEG